MTKALTIRGFTDIVAPTSDRVTADEVRAYLIQLVAATEPGDLSVFYFSGHGWQYPNQSLEPGEGTYDEWLVCCDKPLGDDFFGQELWPKARTGARFIVVLVRQPPIGA